MAGPCTPGGSTTTNYSLCKPATGETGWTAAANGNFDTIDSTMFSISQSATAPATFNGVVVRTSTDSSLINSQVDVTQLLNISTSSGARYSNVVVPGSPTKLTCDITVGGVNGLDTGSKQNSTWYKLLYIAKTATLTVSGAANNGSGLIRITTSASHGLATGEYVQITGVVGTTEANFTWKVTNVDATHLDLQNSIFTNAYVSGGTIKVVGLVFHRAKNFALDQNQTSAGSSQGINSAAGNQRVGEKFTPTLTGYVDFVDVNLTKTGSPTGNIWWEIQADSSGSPSGTALATSDKYDVSRLPGSGLFVRFPFRLAFSVTASTLYWLVARVDYATSGVNFINWNFNAAGTNLFYTYNGSAWAAVANATAAYKVYIRQNDTAENSSLPSGYDQYVLISWAYVNSGGNLKKFKGADRLYRFTLVSDWNLGTFVSGATLLDASGSFPPIPVQARIGVEVAINTGYGLASINGTDLSRGTNTQDAWSIVGGSVAGTGAAASQQIPVFVEYQALMMDGGAASQIDPMEFQW